VPGYALPDREWVDLKRAVGRSKGSWTQDRGSQVAQPGPASPANRDILSVKV